MLMSAAVEQATSINQSTGNATASSAADSTGVAYIQYCFGLILLSHIIQQYLMFLCAVPAPFKWKKGKMLGRGAFGEVSW